MNRIYYHAPHLDEAGDSNQEAGEFSIPSHPSRFPVDNADEANLISSQVNATMHMPVLDIDGIPVSVVPSSTPGNCHLYIDKPMDWPVYRRLLDALADAGIIQRGYAEASIERRATFVRKPGIKKPEVAA